MKTRALLSLLVVLALLVAPGQALAQSIPGATLIQESNTNLRACTPANGKGATNAAVTVTITPPAGQSVYICGVTFEIVNNATGAVVSTQLCWTTTNLGSLQWCFSSTNALNSSTSFYPPLPAQGVKSVTPGTAVTVVSPAANAQALYNINVYYWFGA